MALLVILTLLVCSPVLYYFFVLRSNTDALWQIVSQKCLPSHQLQQGPGACLLVDQENQYVLFKDRNGPHHDLLMPTFPVSGLEAPILEDRAAPSFVAMAWATKGRLAEEAGFPIPDPYLSLAINSRLGRSQDHLHIHISCLKPEVAQVLGRQASGITAEWSEIPEPVLGKQYLARRIAADALAGENPIVMLNDYLRAQGQAPGDYGLGVAQLADGDLALLATGRKLLSLDLGSIGRMQDFTCSLAQNPG